MLATLTPPEGERNLSRDVPEAAAAEKPGGDYHGIFRGNEVPGFAIPFYDILILGLPMGPRIRDLARESLQTHWTTSWARVALQIIYYLVESE